MAKPYLAVVTATGDNIAFQIEVSNIGTIVLEHSINGTKWVVDREISEMFVFSNVAGLNSIKHQCRIGFRYLCGIKHL